MPGKLRSAILPCRPPRSQTLCEFLGDRFCIGASAAGNHHAPAHDVPPIVDLLYSERPIHVDGHAVKLLEPRHISRAST